MPTKRSCATQIHATTLSTDEVKLPPTYIIYPRTLPTAHAIPAQHFTSCENAPISTVLLPHRHWLHQSEVSYLSTSGTDPFSDSISSEHSCSSLCPSSSLTLLPLSRPKPNVLPPLRQKHNQTEQSQATSIK